MIDLPLSDFLDDYHYIMRVTIVAQVLILIFTIIASTGHPVVNYLFLRLIISSLLLIVAFLDLARDGKVFIYFWIIFATFFNPVIPFYFHNKETWQNIDTLVFFITAISLFINIVFYYSGLHVANHIERRARRRHYSDIVKYLFIVAETNFNQACFETKKRKKEMYFDTSNQICNIILWQYDSSRVEFWLLRGIVKAKQHYFQMGLPDFKEAKELDERIIIPNAEDINDLTYTNYKEKLYPENH